MIEFNNFHKNMNKFITLLEHYIQAVMKINIIEFHKDILLLLNKKIKKTILHMKK